MKFPSRTMNRWLVELRVYEWRYISSVHWTLNTLYLCVYILIIKAHPISPFFHFFPGLDTDGQGEEGPRSGRKS